MELTEIGKPVKRGLIAQTACLESENPYNFYF